ncbi:hypothetical protein BKA65DRAFT_217738 [Rhexocercosporidium sp. MPI-PUGE-AT-0058]|nr:hypothetical protein BKA65DRAFT_217738 [Rhexocercosporidium sp. MPI-PUGE-AT-0058]
MVSRACKTVHSIASLLIVVLYPSCCQQIPRGVLTDYRRSIGSANDWLFNSNSTYILLWQLTASWPTTTLLAEWTYRRSRRSDCLDSMQVMGAHAVYTVSCHVFLPCVHMPQSAILQLVLANHLSVGGPSLALLSSPKTLNSTVMTYLST